MNKPTFFQQSHSKVFSSVNGIPIVDKEIIERMDNIKLQILERYNKKIKSYQIPILNIKKNNKNKIFQRQKQIAKNLVLQKTMKNFKNIRDSISLAKERKLKSILKVFEKFKIKPTKKKKRKNPQKRRKRKPQKEEKEKSTKKKKKEKFTKKKKKNL